MVLLFGLIGFGLLLLAVGVLYAAWFVLTFGITLLVARMMGGASMAVVEGVADAGAVRQGSLEMAGVLLLSAQVIIVPWVLGTGWLLRRILRSS